MISILGGYDSSHVPDIVSHFLNTQKLICCGPVSIGDVMLGQLIESKFIRRIVRPYPGEHVLNSCFLTCVSEVINERGNSLHTGDNKGWVVRIGVGGKG